MANLYDKWEEIKDNFIMFGESKVFTNFFDSQERKVVTVAMDNHGLHDDIPADEIESEMKLYDEIIEGHGTQFWKLPRRTTNTDFGLMEEFAKKNHRKLMFALGSRHPMSKFNEVVYELNLFTKWSDFREDYYRQKLIEWAKEHDIACLDK